jgi:hypothetical protein
MVEDYVADSYGVGRLNGGYTEATRRKDVEDELNSKEAGRLPGPVYVFDVTYGVSASSGNDPFENTAVIVLQQYEPVLLMPANYPFIRDYLDR